MKNGRMQAKDVSEEAVLAFLRAHNKRFCTHWRDPHETDGDACPSIGNAFPGVPEKVLLSKLESMKRRGLVAGGGGRDSRGDWHIPELFYAEGGGDDT